MENPPSVRYSFNTSPTPRGRIELLDVPAVTSAARYRSGGYVRRSARNLACLGLYFLGLPPGAITRFYR